MRIISVRVSAVANVLALVYALVGIVVFANYEMGTGQSLTLPVGIVAPFLNLNLNVNLARSLEWRLEAQSSGRKVPNDDTHQVLADRVSKAGEMVLFGSDDRQI